MTAGPSVARVLCGVDASAEAMVAAEQAALIAEPGGSVRILCVHPETGFETGRLVRMSAAEANAAVQAALMRVTRDDVRVTGGIRESDDPVRTLCEQAEDADLLVVGTHGASRRAGIVLGSVASALVHRAPGPVLVAREPPAGGAFPQRIVVASDGSEGAGAAVDLAGALARTHGATLWLLGVDGRLGGRTLADHTRRLAEILGDVPLRLERTGRPHAEIVAGAETAEASLLVVGARGLGGVRALGSVSERVAHEAPCSVLVARGRPPRGA